MIVDLFKYISDEIRLKNTFFNHATPLAFRLPDKQVVEITTKKDFKYCGFEDSKGSAFYIRIEPNTQFAQAARQMSSLNRSIEATYQCVLVGYSFKEKFNSLLLLQKLAQDLSAIKFADYEGTEQSIKLTPIKGNYIEQEVYKQETGKDYDGGNTFSALSISFTLKFITTKNECLKDCDIFLPLECKN